MCSMMTAATDTKTTDQLVHELDQLYTLRNTMELLCRRCHRLVHDMGFRLVRDQYGNARLVRRDGRPVMNRPAPSRPDVKQRIVGPPPRKRRPPSRLRE
jgi:hypothetical protein